jgi:hypothetical protein
VSEGDALFEKHAAWIRRSHYRVGEKALLEYHVSKCAELENPLDPSSARTGNTTFALTEIYAKRAGLDDHWRQAMVLWDDFEEFASFARKCRITTVHGGEIVQHLW